MISSNKWLCFLGSLIMFLLIIYTRVNSQPASKFSESHWLETSKAIEKLKQDRLILVSVKSQPSQENKKNLKIIGAGWVKKDIEFVFNTANRYELLPKVSKHIRKSEYNALGQQLFLQLEAYNYTTELWFKLNLHNSSKNIKAIKFEVVKGVFKTMNGELNFKKIDNEHTQMKIEAQYQFKSLPMPDFFLEFALEVVMQKVAARMRTFIESYGQQSDFRTME